MTGHTKDWLAVGLPLLAVLILGVAAKAESWSDVLVTAFPGAALAVLAGLVFLVSRLPPGDGLGEDQNRSPLLEL
jgi:hypothetical protein